MYPFFDCASIWWWSDWETNWNTAHWFTKNNANVTANRFARNGGEREGWWCLHLLSHFNISVELSDENQPHPLSYTRALPPIDFISLKFRLMRTNRFVFLEKRNTVFLSGVVLFSMPVFFCLFRLFLSFSGFFYLLLYFSFSFHWQKCVIRNCLLVNTSPMFKECKPLLLYLRQKVTYVEKNAWFDSKAALVWSRFEHIWLIHDLCMIGSTIFLLFARWYTKYCNLQYYRYIFAWLNGDLCV